MKATSSDIIDGIYAAAVRPESWIDVLVLMENSFDSVASSFFVQNTDGGCTDGAAHGFDAAWVRSWQSHFAPFNPLMDPLNGVLQRRTMTDADHDAGRDARARFDRTYYYNDWARPQGFRHALGSIVDLRDDRVLAFNFWREASVGSYTAEEIDRYVDVSAHLVRATKVAAEFTRLRQEMTKAQAAGGGKTSGVITLDVFGRVRDMNAEASRIVAAGDGLTIRGDRLTAFLPADTEAIRRLIHAASATTLVGTEEFGPVVVHRKDSRLPLKIKLIAMPGQTSPFPDDDAVAMIVVIQDLQSERKAIDRRIGEVSLRFGLSVGEQSIVKHLLGARNLREAAERAGIGYETARTQIKAAFSKTNTASQIELLRLVAG